MDRYKAQLVTKGFHQRPDLDYHDTFSSVVKPTTIHLVFSLATSNGWCLRQLDVNNAFLQGILIENVFMAQPLGFTDIDQPNHVYRLRNTSMVSSRPLVPGTMNSNSFYLPMVF